MNLYQHWEGQSEPTGDSRNIRSDILTWRAEALPHQIPIPWGLVGDNGETLPVQYGPHPYNPGLFADTYAIRAYGVQSLITIRFSNNRQWRQPNPPPDPTEQGFSSWSLSSVIVNIKVPILYKVPTVVPLPAGPIVKMLWTVGYEEVPHAQTISIWRGSAAEFNPSTIEELVHAQVDKLHQFVPPNGHKRLFESGVWDQRSQRWEVQYQWRIDHGTARPADWIDTATKIYPPIVGTLHGANIIRNPYTAFVVIASSDPENIPPTVVLQSLKAENLTGWTSLPGPIPPP